MRKFRGRLYKTDRARDFEHEHDRYVRRRQIYETVDRQSYQWVVVLVAGVGFFLDGYTLFASNMTLPMISYVYWRDDTSGRKSTFINIATLAGTLLGQVSFGILADKNGRKKMYGIELILLIGSTLGVAMASNGEHNSMSIFAWLIWWRIMVGIGVGADYPLSAVITSEFAPTQHRARMMATVFFMQPLGQIAGNLVSLIVVAVSQQQGGADMTRTVDMMWRWVIGIGVVPGVVALLFRLAIPETPRFLLEIEDDPVKAEVDAATLFGEDAASPAIEIGGNSIMQLSTASERSRSTDEDTMTTVQTDQTVHSATLNSRWPFAKADIIQYFWVEGNWRTLAGTSLCWMLLDFGYYGIDLSSPHFLAKTWGSLNVVGSVPAWETSDKPNTSLFDMFRDTSAHALVILNTGSFVGGILMIAFAGHLNTVHLQKYGFLTLAALFIALGVVFITVHTEGPLAVCLMVLGQLLFNFGPNATTYIIPSEVFPTRYRGTCHGISAGSGKLGSILVQVFSAYYKFGSSPGDAATIRYGWILMVFSACMILGAAVTHFLVPPNQQRDQRNKTWGGKAATLESLALGRQGEGSRYVIRHRSFRGLHGLYG